MSDVKATNPKDAAAWNRLPLHLVPDTIPAFAALAFAEGALKYGAFNWRESGVRSSVYIDAARRHLACWVNGEEVDPVTGVPHLGSVLACIGIILDAQLCGKLSDDRPPPAPVGDAVRGMSADIVRLKALLAPQ
jgi:hypothetical protein